MALDPKLKAIYAGSNASRPLETLEISHEDWPVTQYIVNDDQTWQFELEDGSPKIFIPVPFTVKLPTKDVEGRQDLSIIIANAGREMIGMVETAAKRPNYPLQVNFRIFLDTPMSRPMNNPPLRLDIGEVTADNYTVTAVASRFEMLNRKWPTVLYTADMFPGLVR